MKCNCTKHAPSFFIVPLDNSPARDERPHVATLISLGEQDDIRIHHEYFQSMYSTAKYAEGQLRTGFREPHE